MMGTSIRTSLSGFEFFTYLNMSLKLNFCQEPQRANISKLNAQVTCWVKYTVHMALHNFQLNFETH